MELKGAPKYKLYYFNMRGLGDTIRMCLAQAGLQFQDVRISPEEWPKYKDKMPFGQLPVLEVDGVMVSQSMTILRHLARKYGLEAEHEWDRVLADELATSWLDLYPKAAPAWAETDIEAKKRKFAELVEEFVKPRLAISERRIGASGTGFVAGDRVTWCDLAVYNQLVMLRDYLRIPFDPYPALLRFIANIERLPRINQFLEQNAAAHWSKVPGILEKHPCAAAAANVQPMKEEK